MKSMDLRLIVYKSQGNYAYFTHLVYTLNELLDFKGHFSFIGRLKKFQLRFFTTRDVKFPKGNNV